MASVHSHSAKPAARLARPATGSRSLPKIPSTKCGVNCAIAAKATSPIEASELRGDSISAQTSASATMPTIAERRTTIMRRPSTPAASSVSLRRTAGKIRSFETIVASAVASTMTMALAELIPPRSAIEVSQCSPAASGSASTNRSGAAAGGKATSPASAIGRTSTAMPPT